MKIAILYHHTDENYAESLRKHLELLKGQVPELVIWSYKESDLGERQEVLNAQIKGAAQIIFLLSIDALTDAILCGGVTYARQQNIVLTPILVRACDYENSPLVSDLPILPISKAPISQAKDSDQIWKYIAHQLVTTMGFTLASIKKTNQPNTATQPKNVFKDNTVTGGVVVVGDNAKVSYIEPKTPLPKELTVRLPRQNLNDIIGRRDTLKELRGRLSSQKQVVLVNGMGGIGKTTLAAVYVAEYYKDYEHIAWVTQLSEDVVASFIQTEGLLKQFQINPTGLKPQEVFMALMNGFKGVVAQPCLLVIDNAFPDLRKYAAYLPSQPHWHILVTARERIQGFNVLQLDFLNETEAIALFQKHYTRQKLSVSFIQELVKTLDYHTLTIEILAKTAQRSRTSPEKLLTALKTDLKTGIYTTHSEQRIERVLSYLCSIFEQQQLNEIEAHILVQCACLPAEWHDYE